MKIINFKFIRKKEQKFKNKIIDVFNYSYQKKRIKNHTLMKSKRFNNQNAIKKSIKIL